MGSAVLKKKSGVMDVGPGPMGLDLLEISVIFSQNGRA